MLVLIYNSMFLFHFKFTPDPITKFHDLTFYFSTTYRNLFIFILLSFSGSFQKALRNKTTEMPEPTQWDNNEIDKSSELKDHLDSIPCTESEGSDTD